MTMVQVAELLAVHLWAALFAITSLMLLLSALLWHGLQRYGVWQTVHRLGAQVVLSLAVAVFAFLGFVEIADEIGADEDLGQFDTALSTALSSHANETQLQMFATLTHLGDKRWLIPLAVVIAAILWWRRHRFLATAWVIATASGGLLNTALKAYFERARPEFLHGFATADGWSFPSGHSSGACIVYGLLAYLLVILAPKRFHLLVAASAMLLIVCVGFSRVVLQVHYFSDVLGGFAFGAAWVAAWIAGLEAYRRRLGAGEPMKD
ncbi:phosphatase PAP2 family protein [Steroidobacter sp.]|uniref:phosphatase PAP2 family protein n=1 Tax=Steroidobacter sp. TaxID=1978227 RepID=UPI001A48B066|nr:phosphatase PAP2 family protein [Steroidobacter sp.]MBL8268751.1 phosphatase PAP2 family protein [Steroidobacter sp.]